MELYTAYVRPAAFNATHCYKLRHYDNDNMQSIC